MSHMNRKKYLIVKNTYWNFTRMKHRCIKSSCSKIMMHSNIHLIFFYLFCTISFFLVIPAAFAKGARDTASSKTSTETDIISPPEFTPAYERKNIDGDPVSFHEIWGYV